MNRTFVQTNCSFGLVCLFSPDFGSSNTKQIITNSTSDKIGGVGNYADKIKATAVHVYLRRLAGLLNLIATEKGKADINKFLKELP